MNKLLSFLRLPVAEQLLLLQVILGLTLIRLSLRICSLQRTRALLSQLAQPLRRETAEVKRRDVLARVARAVTLASRAMPHRATCLVQALTAQLFLERRGIATRLHIGFAKAEQEGRVEGHAWLEYQGEVVIGDNGELGRFAPPGSLSQQ